VSLSHQAFLLSVHHESPNVQAPNPTESVFPRSDTIFLQHAISIKDAESMHAGSVETTAETFAAQIQSPSSRKLLSTKGCLRINFYDTAEKA
jgi:hypothetical protein